MSLHPGTESYNPAGNSDFTRRAEKLALEITNWSTPKATDGTKGGPGQRCGTGGMPPLPAQAARWQTPVADDHAGRTCGKVNSRGEAKLRAQAILWPTPAAQNWKGSSPASIMRTNGKSRMDLLHYRAEQGFSLPDPVITPHGSKLSVHAPISRPLWASMIASHGRATSRRILKGRAKRRLNAVFVEWLMGWPVLRLRISGRETWNHFHWKCASGHTLCACPATAFVRWQQHMRGALSQLPMASGPWIWRPTPAAATEAVQMDLFDGDPS